MRPFVAVSDTGRYYDHITRLDLDRLTLRPAECDVRRTSYHAKHLVGIRVVVMIGEDPVHPRAAPTVFRKQLLAARGILIAPIERLWVHEQRQCRVVGYAAVVLEKVF